MSGDQDWYAKMIKEQEERKRQLLMKLTDGEVMAWADKMHAEGFELKMTWDGGGDSGWVDFECDKDNLTEEDTAMIEILRDICYEELDYGSWAGEFSANGEAIYDPETKCFEGTDFYSEDDQVSVDCDIEVRIPKDLWFDRIEIMIQDEEAIVSTDIIVNNGFKIDRHTEAENAINESVSDQVDEIINKVEGYEYRGMWEEITLNRSDFVIEGDEAVAHIHKIDVGIYRTEEKEIFINLNPEEE